MKGKAKLVHEKDNNYHIYIRDYFWQSWKPLIDNSGKPIIFKDFSEFGKITKIECFDKIIIEFDNFSGFRE